MIAKSKELKAVWVLENAKIDRIFGMSEIELLYMVTSVLQWKKFYPNVPTCLICTPEVCHYLCDLDLVYLWDWVDIEILQEKDNIRRDPFWACSKIKAMRSISAPFVMMDNDLYLKQKSIVDEDFDRCGVIASHIEDGSGYYPISNNPVFRNLPDLYKPDFTGTAFNVSFLYIRDEEMRIKYSGRAYDWMTKLSESGQRLHGGHMIFCEQKLLYDMTIDDAIPYKVLINDVFDCRQDQFKNITSTHTLEHLGVKKKLMQRDLDKFIKARSGVLMEIKDYHNIKHIFGAINKSKKLDDDKFYTSSKFDHRAQPTPLKHENSDENKICVVYNLWEDIRYIPYLKYSIISLITFTDVKDFADIKIFISEHAYLYTIECLKELVSENSFVRMKNIKAFKYITPTHPELAKYERIVMLDTDAFFNGQNSFFADIEKFYSQESKRGRLIMPMTNTSARETLWNRKNSLCSSMTDDEYLEMIKRHTSEEAIQLLFKGAWYLSSIIIYGKENFKEPGYVEYALESFWNEQKCDETVFLTWARHKSYLIEDISVLIKYYDVYDKIKDVKPALYHPIVGLNSRSYSNEELLQEIENRHKELINEMHIRKLEPAFSEKGEA